jgi:hypothetical protein
MPFMTHPRHGALNCTGSEVAEHEKNGWKLSTPEDWVAHKMKPTTPDIDTPAPRKPGRPRKE